MASAYSDLESRIRQAAQFRHRAETARRVALTAKHEGVGEMFLSDASHYETLALIAERWIDPQRPAPASPVTEHADRLKDARLGERREGGGMNVLWGLKEIEQPRLCGGA